MYNLQQIESAVNQFDKMKFIDEDGKEKISGRELAKAMGYSDWRNFKSAIKRTNDQIKASGKADSEQIVEVTSLFDKGNGAKQEGSDYILTRKQAINVANNCDTSKPQVALVQQYLYETSEVGQKAINIYNRMKDKLYIDNRAALATENREFARTCLEHGTKQNELGIIHNACDEAMYGMSTKEIKDTFGKSNRSKADFVGSMMCNAEALAKQVSYEAINKENANGMEECKDISSEIHSDIANYITIKTGKTPVEHITGEDVKKVEKRYNKQIEEQLKAIEHEF